MISKRKEEGSNKQQKYILFVSILASLVVFLDGSVVNIALPAITRELGGGLAIQQWITDAYLITLGALILAAGSFSDIFGRKKIMIFGLLGFAVTSIFCALSPTGELLVISRALQGVAGALLVPSSLALIVSAFSGKAQAKAIGTWTAWTGISFIAGPLIGGLIIDFTSWRFVFGINIIPITIALWILSLVAVKKNTQKRAKIDYTGIILGAAGLGGTVYALIEQSRFGWQSPFIYLPFVLGILALVIFIWHEHRVTQPMLPPELFKVRNFSAGNIATFFVYAALSLQGFLIVIFLQQVAKYSALEAGLAPIPITILMFFLSSRFGALAGKYGPRLFMALGPFICSLSMIVLFLSITPSAVYWREVLPCILLFGIGLSITVAPLTAAILGSIKAEQAGIGSAINNAVSRIAGLLAIAAIGIFIGNTINLEGLKLGVLICALLLLLGSIVSAIGIQNEHVKAKGETQPVG